MNEKGKKYEEVIQEIDAIREKDVSWENVYNSICSKPLPISVEAYMKGIETNLGDVRIFRETAKIEQKVIDFMKTMLHSKDGAGNIVSGGTEANLLALYVARKRASNIKDPEVVVCDTVHYSFLKAVEIMNIKCVITPHDGKYQADVSAMEQAITENTIAIIATAGTSEFGNIDPICQLAEIAYKRGIYFHVDAASGGFILPFAKKLGYQYEEFDFQLPGVCSITVDPHKYGLIPIPAGAILFRSKELQNLICLDSYFLGTPSHTTFVGTRGGAAVLSAYATFQYLGMEGYMEITKRNLELTRMLAGMLKENGFTLLMEPIINIVAVKVADGTKVLETKGIIVSASKRVKNVIRIVVNNHMNESMIEKIVAEIKQIV